MDEDNQQISTDANMALTQGLLNFSKLLVGLAPSPHGGQAYARMRPANALRMRDDEDNTGDDNFDADSHEENDDPEATIDEADAEANTDGGQDDDDFDKESKNRGSVPSSPIPPMQAFDSAPGGPLLAVDAGMVKLAETASGPISAIRTAIVAENSPGTQEKSQVYLMRSGPLFLPWARQLQVLHAVGKALGDPGLFATLDRAEPTDPRPVELKRGSDRPDLFAQRIMVLWERLAQQMAVELAPKNAILLIDGALTLRSRDTPPRFLKELVKKASNKGVSIVAVSKQSNLLVGPNPQAVKAIQFWLDDAPNQVGYRLLSPMLDKAGYPAAVNPSKNGLPQQPRRADRILGRCYAVRFSPLGETYRLDLHAAPGNTDAEVMDQFLASTMIVSGYPSIAAQAHAHGYFSTTDVLALQVQATGMYGLSPQMGLSSTGAFAPYQGSYK